MPPRLVVTLVAALATALVAAAAAAPPPPRPAGGDGATSRPSSPPSGVPAGGLLAGPRVEPGALSRGDEPAERPNRGRRPAIAPRRWMAVLRELELSRGQRADVRRIAGTMARERRAFQRQHGPEMRRLRRAVAEARESGTPPPDDLVARFEAIRAKAPDVERRQHEIWKLLTPRQQDEMRRTIVRERGGGRGDRRVD